MQALAPWLDLLPIAVVVLLGALLAKHFADETGLHLLAIETERLDALRWEPSRGGDLFPHLYGALATDKVRAVTEAPLGDDGVPQLGNLA